MYKNIINENFMQQEEDNTYCLSKSNQCIAIPCSDNVSKDFQTIDNKNLNLCKKYGTVSSEKNTCSFTDEKNIDKYCKELYDCNGNWPKENGFDLKWCCFQTKSESNCDNSCFSNNMKIELDSGKKINISDAKIGDKILSYDPINKKLVYSDIIFIPHKKSFEKDFLIKIITKNNLELVMTKCHYMPIKNKNNIVIKKANNLEINDKIITINGEDMISNIKIIEDIGKFTVITNEEFIVVNDIITSPFGSNISHNISNKLYNLLRFIYKIDTNINKLFSCTS